jgi:hypothetical protein
VRAALADRLLVSEAVLVVSQMLRGYANGGQQASKGYIGALAEVLAGYPRCVAGRAGDLLTGVPSECRFLPTPADVIAWCEREVADLRTIVNRDDEENRVLREMRERREDAARLDRERVARPSLDELRAKHGQNWGIGQSDQVIGDAAAASARVRGEETNRALLFDEYAQAGVDPVEAAPGIVLSLELVRQIADRSAQAAERAEAAE